MKLSEKIKEYRNIFDISQEDLAEKLNVSRQAITKWETGDGLPEISNIKTLAKLMGVSLDYLLDETKKLEYPIKRRCLRCNVEMLEDYDIKVEGASYGIKLAKQGILTANLGKILCAVCPECGYLETYIEDTTKLKKSKKEK